MQAKFFLESHPGSALVRPRSQVSTTEESGSTFTRDRNFKSPQRSVLACHSQCFSYLFIYPRMQSLHAQAGVRTWVSLTPLLDHGIPVLGKRRGAANTSLGLEKCLGLALFQGHSTPRGFHSVMFHISFFTLSLVHRFPLLSTGSWHLLSFKPLFQPNSWQKTVERSCFLRLLMG